MSAYAGLIEPLMFEEPAVELAMKREEECPCEMHHARTQAELNHWLKGTEDVPDM